MHTFVKNYVPIIKNKDYEKVSVEYDDHHDDGIGECELRGLRRR